MSVRVAVRVRPFNSREKERDPQCCVRMVSNLYLYLIIRLEQKQLYLMNLEMKRNLLSIILSGHMIDSKKTKMGILSH